MTRVLKNRDCQSLSTFTGPNYYFVLWLLSNFQKVLQGGPTSLLSKLKKRYFATSTLTCLVMKFLRKLRLLQNKAIFVNIWDFSSKQWSGWDETVWKGLNLTRYQDTGIMVCCTNVDLSYFKYIQGCSDILELIKIWMYLSLVSKIHLSIVAVVSRVLVHIWWWLTLYPDCLIACILVHIDPTHAHISGLLSMYNSENSSFTMCLWKLRLKALTCAQCKILTGTCIFEVFSMKLKKKYL